MKREVLPARPVLLVQSWWFWLVTGALAGWLGLSVVIGGVS